MKRIVLFLIVAAAIFALYWFKFRSTGGDSGPKQQPLALKKHSAGFNGSVNNAMDAYFDMQAAFVDADTAKVKADCRRFIALIDSIQLDELKKDTATIYETAKMNLEDVKANANSLLKQTDITEMRHDFHFMSDMLYPSFFKAINYEGPTVYLQNCPMAFGDGKEANWLSNKEEVVNPYLGKNHPEFKGSMLHCGAVKDSIAAQ
jgi:hypothetical protein